MWYDYSGCSNTVMRIYSGRTRYYSFELCKHTYACSVSFSRVTVAYRTSSEVVCFSALLIHLKMQFKPIISLNSEMRNNLAQGVQKLLTIFACTASTSKCPGRLRLCISSSKSTLKLLLHSSRCESATGQQKSDSTCPNLQGKFGSAGGAAFTLLQSHKYAANIVTADVQKLRWVIHHILCACWHVCVNSD